MKSLLVLLSSVAASMVLGSAPGLAQESTVPKGVVELFTSQGCSSCPPADRVLADLAEQDGVIALAYHVTYWDYLGWKDTLGSEENTQRQYDYMKSFKTRSVYTPQAVINGRTHVNGAIRSQVAGTLDSMSKTGAGMQVKVSAFRTGDSMVVEAGPGNAATEAELVVIGYEPKRSVPIARGENAGATVLYRNSVKTIRAAGMWHGKEMRIELPMKAGAADKLNWAVLLQATDKSGAPGAILGAAIVSANKS